MADRRGGMHPLLELTRVRIVEFVREPEAVFWVFVFPVLLALALGIAFRGGNPEPFRVAVTGSEALAEALAASPRIEATATDATQAAAELRRGAVDLAVEVRQRPGSPPELTYRYDPTSRRGDAARMTADAVLQRALGRRDAARTRDDQVSEPGGRYIDFLIPGLIGLNLMGSGMWGLGFAVVVARTRKLLKRLAATPMRRSHYLLSFMLSRLVFLVLEVAAIAGFGRLVFGVRIEGSPAALAVVAVAGSLTFAGLGLLVAARPTTIEAVSGWMNLVMLPMWLLSGSFFSYERFPAALQPAIRALPLTALNDALRAVINRGDGLLACSSELAVLAVWGAAAFAVALRTFRWQ